MIRSWHCWIVQRSMPGFLALVLVAFTTMTAAAGDFTWRRPAWMPATPVPAGNPMSASKVELGRHLFFDIRLSGPGYMACASCHKPERAFTDGRRVAIGVTGERNTRNTPTLANVAYLARLGWSQPLAEPLELQLRRPIFSEKPVEMGTLGHEVPVLEHIRSNSVYRALFRAAFPDQKGDISFVTIAQAIAAFQRTLISGDAPYDRFMGGDPSALMPAAIRGLALFQSPRLKCAMCHIPPFFTDATRSPYFHNTGLYNEDGRGRLPGTDQGLARDTGDPADTGRFKTPTLRNIAVTSPYMHDGSIETLDAVIAHYAAGGRAAITGKPSPLRSELVSGFSISAAERTDLIAFLQSLTDKTFLTNPRFQTPYR